MDQRSPLRTHSWPPRQVRSGGWDSFDVKPLPRRMIRQPAIDEWRIWRLAVVPRARSGDPRPTARPSKGDGSPGSDRRPLPMPPKPEFEHQECPEAEGVLTFPRDVLVDQVADRLGAEQPAIEADGI